MPWTQSLGGWYRRNGRHDLPWRSTRDPWAILVSEVMLQQTSVARVRDRWGPFVARWPDPGSLAATPLDDVLRAWDGLGYPRRVVALHRTAGLLAASGWPCDEEGLRRLPGVGAYTARALLVLALGRGDGPPPRDVNIARVTARAALGREPHECRPSDIDAALAASRTADLDAREHVLALFDAGAMHCRARLPRCGRCPLAHGCASRDRLVTAPPTPPPRRQARYRGSLRELRGTVLREALAEPPPHTAAELADRVRARLGEVDGARLDAAIRGLAADGLLRGGALAGGCGPSARDAPLPST